MMRSLAVALCCLAFPAFAADAPSNEIIDHANGELKKELRTCSINDDCTYIAKACSNWLAVNTKSKNHARAVMAKISAVAQCGSPSPDAPTPVSQCAEGICTLAPAPK